MHTRVLSIPFQPEGGGFADETVKVWLESHAALSRNGDIDDNDVQWGGPLSVTFASRGLFCCVEESIEARLSGPELPVRWLLGIVEKPKGRLEAVDSLGGGLRPKYEVLERMLQIP